MQKQFPAQFKKLFKKSETSLENTLNQKYKAIMRVDDHRQILTEKDYLL